MQLVVSKPFADKGTCIFMRGAWVTPEVHAAVSRIMNDNYIGSPVYQAKTGCSPFFQGGCNDPHGQWILIEFWGHDLVSRCAFIDLLESAINRVIVPSKTKINVNLYKGTYDDGKGTLTSCLMIADDAKCGYDAGSWGSPFTFLPEDNVTYCKVLDLCKEFGLRVIHEPAQQQMSATPN